MKIDGQRTDHLEKTDDAKRKEEPSKEEDKKDFKKLLERKKGDKSDKSDKKTPKKAGRKIAKNQKTSDKTPGTMLERQASKPGQTTKFGEGLKDGKLQLGQQSEQHERLGSERNTARHLNETRTEHRHRKKHHRQVHRDHTKHQPSGPSARAGGADKHALAGARGISGKPTSIAAENVEAASPSALIAGAEAAGTSKADGAAASEVAQKSQVDQKRAQVAELARKLVDRAHVGHDASGRQIMLMDLEVPGRGNVRVRLRRRGDGFELRMRPENDELARDLRHEREHFRQSAAEGGVDFTSIEIV